MLHAVVVAIVVAGANMLNYFYLKSRKTIVRRTQVCLYEQRGVKGSGTVRWGDPEPI